MTLSFLLCAALASTSDTELLHFSAPWCQACQQSESAVRQFESSGFPIRHINIDDRPDLARRYNVRTVPSFILVSGGTIVRRIDQAVSYGDLVSFVQLDPTAGHQDAKVDSRSRADARDRADSRQPRRSAEEEFDSRPIRRPRTNAAAKGTEAEQRALRSTVRLRVEDRTGQSYGTGTVIDTHDNECLVLTCGHIFRDSRGQGRITIEMFGSRRESPCEGKLLRFDLENDLALVVFRADSVIDPTRVARDSRATTGSPVFSVGCDRGGEPSLHRGRVNAVNKYVGPPANIVVSGRPVDGRSGGGLFSTEGELIGVCQAADPEINEGLYAHLTAVHDYLKDANLAFVYQDQPASLASAHADASALADHTDSAATRVLPSIDRNLQARSPEMVDPIQETSDVSTNDATEVVCIIRSKANPSAQSQVMVLDRPSHTFLSQLRQEQSTQERRHLTEVRTGRKRTKPTR